MYPRDGEDLEQPDGESVRITLRDLPEGNYTVEFLLPNHDILFEEMPKAQVFLTGGETRKIDFSIEPHYGQLQGRIKFAEGAVLPGTPRPTRTRIRLGPFTNATPAAPRTLRFTTDDVDRPLQLRLYSLSLH